MRSVTILPMTIGNRAYIEDMLLHVRDSDVDEFFELGGTNFEDGLCTSIIASDECYCAVDKENNVLAIYGIVSAEPICIVWLIGTARITKYKRGFLRESSKTIGRWLEAYGEMGNVISATNRESICWLSWLGAEFTEPKSGIMKFKIGKE